jgi:23S rRNA pseudouridine1911/1915/1917 synthase
MVLTRAKVSRLIVQGFVKVNGCVVVKPSEKVSGDTRLSVRIPKPSDSKLLPDDSVKFGVVYEDDDILVVDKPAGLTVHPGAGTDQRTLVNGLLAHVGEELSHIGHVLRPGIVHRLDKDTSGLMVVAKNDNAFYELSKQFLPPRSIHRTYLAFCQRLPQERYTLRHQAKDLPLGGTIDLAIDRHPNNRTKMAIREGGRESITRWQLKESFAYGHLLQMTLESGRTHQIRVHLQAAGAPILADPVYGEGPANIPGHLRPVVKKLGRQALHAKSLSFIHPKTKERVDFTSSLPEDLTALHLALKGGLNSSHNSRS